jgi:hypothetical protein
LPRHQRKRHALDERGENQLRPHHREMIADADVRDGGTSELARGVQSCRALLISRCGTGLRLIALEQACWYNRAHVMAPLEQSRMDTEKDL